TEESPKINGTADRSLFDWFQSNANRVSAHYYVTFSGAVEQYVLDTDTAHQAGNFQVNLRSIGIEHQDNGYFKANNRKYTDAQYEASAQLVAALCTQHNIPVQFVEQPLDQQASGITIHKKVKDTSCPDALDYARIIQRAQAIVAAGPQAGGNTP